MEMEQLEKLEAELYEYIAEEGTEISETCEKLLLLTNSEPYVSEEFYNALMVELKAQLDNFKENTKWVVTEKEEVVKKTIKELWWKGSDY